MYAMNPFFCHLSGAAGYLLTPAGHGMVQKVAGLTHVVVCWDEI
jgi:hypothetical protein